MRVAYGVGGCSLDIQHGQQPIFQVSGENDIAGPLRLVGILDLVQHVEIVGLVFRATHFVEPAATVFVESRDGAAHVVSILREGFTIDLGRITAVVHASVDAELELYLLEVPVQF